MKKRYLVPTADFVNLSSETNVLLSVSSDSTGNETPEGFGGMGGGDGQNPGGYEGDLSNRRVSVWE